MKQDVMAPNLPLAWRRAAFVFLEGADRAVDAPRDQESEMEFLTASNRESALRNLSPATSLCAQLVVDEKGRVLGSIVDLLLDLERGRIGYAVVADGGFMGLGERLVAIPWGALKAQARQFVLQGKRAALDSCPVFEQEQWHRAPADGWHESVHAHFGTRPYWV